MNAVLGVGGGIAAYKSAELARALMERGLRVQVVLTDAAATIHHAAYLRRAHRPQSHHRICSAPASSEETLIERRRAYRRGPG